MSIDNENRSCSYLNNNSYNFSNNNMNDNSCGCTNNTMSDNSCACNNATRREMINQIKCLGFAVTDLALYLDTHPDDTKALCLYRKYAKELNDLKDDYQKVYGPLTYFFPCNKWRWLEEPWPWERGNF